MYQLLFKEGHARRGVFETVHGSISRDRFIEVNDSSTPVVMEAIKLMDGSKSFDEIDKTVFKTTSFSVKSKDLYEILSRANLLSEADNNKAEKSEFETLALKIFDFRIEKYKKFFSYLSFLAVPALFISMLLAIFTPAFDIAIVIIYRLLAYWGFKTIMYVIFLSCLLLWHCLFLFMKLHMA